MYKLLSRKCEVVMHIAPVHPFRQSPPTTAIVRHSREKSASWGGGCDIARLVMEDKHVIDETPKKTSFRVRHIENPKSFHVRLEGWLADVGWTPHSNFYTPPAIPSPFAHE